MHEVSLNRVITDYLSGQDIMDTTYEDLRQALARMLVEDRQYPRQCLRAKYAIGYAVDGVPQSTVLDLAVFSPEGEPMLALVFCPGEVGTFVRESVAAARIHLPQPFPLVAVTDSMVLLVVETRTGEVLGEGFNAVPLWQDLSALVLSHPCPAPSEDRLAKERRIVMAYNGLGGPCCGGECSL
jgi:hypothetical protein